MAISAETPTVLAIAATSEGAIIALCAKLASPNPFDGIEIPDCLPPEI